MDSEWISTNVETNAAFRLLRQDNLAFVIEVIWTAFSGPDIVEVPETRMVNIIHRVIETRRKRHGPDHLPTSPERYLEEWKGIGHTAPWFGTRKDEFGETRVTLLNEARQVLKFVETCSLDRAELTESRLTELIVYAEETASRLSNDPSRRIALLRRRIAEAEAELAALGRDGLVPLKGAEKKAAVEHLFDRASELRTGFGAIPTDLRRFRREAEDVIQNTDGPARDVLTIILNREDDLKASPSYRALHALRDMHNDPASLSAFTQNIAIIVDECSGHLEPEAAARLRSFVNDLAAASSAIIAEDSAISQLQWHYINRSDFEARREDARALTRAREAMVAIRDTLAPSVRDKRLRDIGLVLPSLPMKAHRFHDIKLALQPPEEPERGAAAPVLTPEQDMIAREKSVAAIRRGEWLSVGAMRRRIAASVSCRGTASLGEVIEDNPLRYGLEELTRYLAVAATNVPAAYQPGMDFTHRFIEAGETMTAETPNPVFLPSGSPATGLEAYIAAEEAAAAREDASRTAYPAPVADPAPAATPATNMHMPDGA